MRHPLQLLGLCCLELLLGFVCQHIDHRARGSRTACGTVPQGTRQHPGSDLAPPAQGRAWFSFLRPCGRQAIAQAGRLSLCPAQGEARTGQGRRGWKEGLLLEQRLRILREWEGDGEQAGRATRGEGFRPSDINPLLNVATNSRCQK